MSRAIYEAARADGCSHEEAEGRVADHLERWRADAERAPTPIAPPAGSRATACRIGDPDSPASRRTSATPCVCCAGSRATRC